MGASVEFMEESMGVSGKRIQDMRGLLGRTRKDIVALSRERTNQRERKRHQDQVSRCVWVPPLPAGRHHPCNGRHDWWQAFSHLRKELRQRIEDTRKTILYHDSHAGDDGMGDKTMTI